jgi:hypothetical protein
MVGSHYSSGRRRLPSANGRPLYTGSSAEFVGEFWFGSELFGMIDALIP